MAKPDDETKQEATDKEAAEKAAAEAATSKLASLSKALDTAPKVEPDPEKPPESVTHTDGVNAVDKVLTLVIDEIQKRFDDRVPVAVLKFLVPHITALVKGGELDAKARMQVQARFDDALRRLGMI